MLNVQLPITAVSNNTGMTNFTHISLYMSKNMYDKFSEVKLLDLLYMGQYRSCTNFSLSLLMHRNVHFPTTTAGGASGKESACQCRRRRRCGFDPWVGKIPWRRKWQSTPVFLPGKAHGQRSLMGYSPWGHKETDTTRHMHTHTHVSREPWNFHWKLF